MRAGLRHKTFQPLPFPQRHSSRTPNKPQHKSTLGDRERGSWRIADAVPRPRSTSVVGINDDNARVPFAPLSKHRSANRDKRGPPALRRKRRDGAVTWLSPLPLHPASIRRCESGQKQLCVEEPSCTMEMRQGLTRRLYKQWGVNADAPSPPNRPCTPRTAPWNAEAELLTFLGRRKSG